ncbi:hypothetical protein AAFF_G00127430 [Aldrovandia affinis]|uniref:Uncharacterized protein n=1 Tax=Aldrovandia affinis TaxID=143900 RepID=A0AAD7WX34_9TELE|nr:hypothetical protein AAFF_G00127430 [Aldrovandia affinis]
MVEIKLFLGGGRERDGKTRVNVNEFLFRKMGRDRGDPKNRPRSCKADQGIAECRSAGTWAAGPAFLTRLTRDLLQALALRRRSKMTQLLLRLAVI